MDATDTLVPFSTLRSYIQDIFVRLGVPADQAAIVADNLATADLRGVESHGANLVALYVERLRNGSLTPRTEIKVLRDEGATVILDGGLGFGQVGGVVAMDLAVERARAHGVAAVAVRESTHLGALGYYTYRAAERGFIALAFQNGPPVIPAYGGLTPIFSTNPFSYAVPAGEEPLVFFDIATTAVAGSKIALYRKRGLREMPAGWAVDERGRPTTDPVAAARGHLQWAAGHKGFGLAMLVEILAGVLAGGSFGHTDISPAEPKGAARVVRSYFFLAIDVERFLPRDEFARRMDLLLRDLHASETAEGFERVYAPGEIEQLRAAERLRTGVPIATAVVRELSAIGATLGLPPLEGTAAPA